MQKGFHFYVGCITLGLLYTVLIDYAIGFTYKGNDLFKGYLEHK